MSALTEPTQTCVRCTRPLEGAPAHRRYCDDCRKARRRESQAEYEARKRIQESLDVRRPAPDRSPTCSGCGARMLRPSDDGLCGFCAVECGARDEADLFAGVGA